MMLIIKKNSLNTFTIEQEEYAYLIKNRYMIGLKLGKPPRFIAPTHKEVAMIQPYDLLKEKEAKFLENISYSQEQLDFISYYAIAIKQALTPVITAFASSPQDMGIIMNFCA